VVGAVVGAVVCSAVVGIEEEGKRTSKGDDVVFITITCAVAVAFRIAEVLDNKLEKFPEATAATTLACSTEYN